MADIVRVIAIGGTLGALVAGGLAAPAFIGSALANEPAKSVVKSVSDLFGPSTFDPRKLRKYAITFDDTVSTEVEHTQTISKIGYGHRTYVSIVTTPSGTYSSDALTSPYVRYPGIDVTPKYYGRTHFSFGSSSSRYGTSSWSSFSSGSFTYYSYNYKPTPRR